MNGHCGGAGCSGELCRVLLCVYLCVYLDAVLMFWWSLISLCAPRKDILRDRS